MGVRVAGPVRWEWMVWQRQSTQNLRCTVLKARLHHAGSRELLKASCVEKISLYAMVESELEDRKISRKAAALTLLITLVYS